MRPVLLLGIGCQKAGTTWLYNYLARHPQVAKDTIKEFHVLDVRHVPHFADFHAQQAANKRRLIGLLERGGDDAAAVSRRARLEDELACHERSMGMVRDIGRYTAHMRALAASAPGVRLVCDITPSYCVLDAAHWRELAPALEGAGLDVRLVFIMRDPVERLFSAYRMHRRSAEELAMLATGANRVGAAKARLRSLRRAALRAVGRRPAETPFLAYASEEINVRRGQYERTIRAVEAAFPPDRLHLVFFEEFFKDASLRQLTDFAGIDFVPADYTNTAQTGSGGATRAPSDVAALRARLEPTYRFCAERFGAERIAALWPNA